MSRLQQTASKLCHDQQQGSFKAADGCSVRMQGATIVQNVRITGNSLGDVDLAANTTLNDTRAWYTGYNATGKWESMTSCAPQFRYDLEAYLATHTSHYKSLQASWNSMICKFDDSDYTGSLCSTSVG